MAIETGFFRTGEIKTYWKAEATLGATETVATGYTELPIISMTIPEGSASVEQSTSRIGTYTKSVGQTTHREDTKVWTFDLVMKGNASTIDFVMEKCIEGSTSPYTLPYNYSPPEWKTGVVSANSFKLLIEGAGTSSPNASMNIKGCIGTGFTIGQSIDSENGECMVTLNCMTAYAPYSNSVATSSPTAVSSDEAYNIKDNDTYNINDGTSEDLMIYSWELSATRPVERVGASTYTHNQPFGYAMTGGWEVTGSLSVKRDASIDGIKDSFVAGDVAINVGEASGLLVGITDAFMNDASIDNGGSILKQTIPFTSGTPTSASGHLFSITCGT